MAKPIDTNALNYSQQMLIAVQGISDILGTMMKAIQEVGDNAKKDAKEVNKQVEKTHTKVKLIRNVAAGIYGALKLDKIVRQAEALGEEFLSTAKRFQQLTGSATKEWNAFYESSIKSAKQLNTELGKNVFNSKEFLVAANKLASIGWSDLKSLSNVAPALSQINRAVGVTTSSFNKSVLNLQRVFQESTDELVTRLGDTITSYSTIFGVTAEELQDVMSSMQNAMLYYADGNQALYEQMNKSLSGAVAVYKNMGVDSDKMVSLFKGLMQATDAELAEYSAAFNIAGADLRSMQAQLQAGNFEDVAIALSEGIANITEMNKGGMDTKYMEMMEKLGLSRDDMMSIANNVDNLPALLEQIKRAEEDSANAMSQRLSDSIMNLPQRMANWLSNSQFIGALQRGLLSIGVGSLKDAVSMASGITSVGTSLADRLGPLLKNNEDGSMSVLGSIVKKFTSGGLFSGLVKLGAAAAALAVVFKAITDVVKSEEFKPILDKLKEAFATVKEVLGEVISSLADVLRPVIEFISDVLMSVLDALSDILLTLADVLKQLQPIIKTVMDILAGTLKDLLNGILDVLSGVLKDVLQLFVSLMQTIVGIIMKVMDPLVSIINVVLKLVDLLGTLVNTVLNVVLNVLGGVLRVALEGIATLLEYLMAVLEPIITVFNDIFSSLSETVMPILDMLIQFLDSIMQAIKPFVDLIMQLFTDQMKQGLQVLQQLMGFLVNILSPILKVLSPILEAIMKPIQALMNGLATIFNWLADISIFGWHPFEGLRMDTPGITTNSSSALTEITNETVQNTYNQTNAAGGLTYGFGLTSQGFHVGQDIPLSSSTPLSANQVGLVTGTGSNSTYGNYMSMLGSDGVEWLFAHLNSVSAKSGDTILPGEVFGTSGNTGNSELPHVHVETRVNDRFVDPYLVAKNQTSNADVVHAIEVMTQRLEDKLEEVSQKTDDNAEWIKKFDAERKAEQFKAL